MTAQKSPKAKLKIPDYLSYMMATPLSRSGSGYPMKVQMGTWTVIGDIQRVYRGPDLHYNGWQRASNTTPDELFGSMLGSSEAAGSADTRGQADTARASVQAGTAGTTGTSGLTAKAAAVPAWARRFEEATGAPEAISRSPEESRERLISHIREFFPLADGKTLSKLI